MQWQHILNIWTKKIGLWLWMSLQLTENPTFWKQFCFLNTNLMKFYIWTINWVTRFINCYCSYKGCINSTTTMEIGHKFWRQYRRQALTCSHRPKHMRKQNLLWKNSINMLLSGYPRSFNGHWFWSISLTMRLLNTN